jgi:HAE1 family hydrophobic/amphiphilic exporter-1
MAAGVQLDMLDRQASKVERTILNTGGDVAVTAAFIGDDANDGDEWHKAWFRVRLQPRGQRERGVEEIRSDMERRIGPIAGMDVKVQTSRDMMVFRMLNRRGSGDVEVEIRGHDVLAGERLANSVARLLQQIPGLTNVDVAKEDRRPVMSAVINRTKASLLGISVTDIAQTVETTMRGTEATVYHEDGEEYNVLVRLCESDRSEQSDVGRVGIATPNGSIIPLQTLVRFAHSNDSLAINRLDQQRTITVTADVTDRDLGSVIGDLQQRLQEMSVPQGFTINVAGDWEEQQRSFRALTYGLIMAIVLMYMVMASQFESIRDPLIILTTIPLGAIGVILMLALSDTTLNAQSFIGIVMLSGIVVNNAIVLIDYTNQLQNRDPDADVRALIIKSTTRRFRPILMTTVTTILSMTPIAFGWGEGGELQAPLARVVIGGLLSGTLVTLIAIPILQQFLLNQRNSQGERDFASDRERLVYH